MHALYSNHIGYNETPTLPVLNGPPSWVVRSASKKRPIRSSIQTVYSGNPKTSTSTNSEDPYEMPHNAAFHKGLHCLYAVFHQCLHYLYRLKIFRQKNIIYFEKYNLTSLDFYNVLSQVSVSNQEAESIKIQRVILTADYSK